MLANPDTLSSPLVPLLGTIHGVIEQHAIQHPERAAIIGHEFAPLCYRDLDARIKSIGQHLRSSGIGARSRVAILLPRGPEAALVGIATAAHAICVPLMPGLTAA